MKQNLIKGLLNLLFYYAIIMGILFLHQPFREDAKKATSTIQFVYQNF